jgi:tRNA(adenine34) deaminase
MALVADQRFMRLAQQQASLAAKIGEVPVGAVIVRDGEVIAGAHNRREVDRDPTAHAELLAIKAAARTLGDWRLENCTLYVTLEPCAMCAGAMVLARIERCVYGCTDPRGGYLGTLGDLSQVDALNHHFQVEAGVDADACSEQLRTFFRALRAEKNAKKASPRSEG